MATVISIVSKAKASLNFSHPFFGSLLMRFPTIETDDIPTMATDGARVYFNPTFTEALSKDEVIGVLAHEACHIALLHTTRKGTRDHQLWNIACDFAINPILLANGLKLPAGALDLPQFHNKSAEQIYKELTSGIKGGKIKVEFQDGTSDGEGGTPIKEQSWGGVNQNPEAKDAATTARIEAETKVSVLQSAQTAKARGNLPSQFEGLIADYRSSKVNWKERLRTFVGGNHPSDYSFRRSNRKAMALYDAYLPTVENRGAGLIIIGVDSSGSVGKEEMEQFFGEIKSIHEELSPDETVVVWCDTKVQHVDRYATSDSIDTLKRHGNGGTTLSPVFKWVEEQGLVPDSFVFLTDMEIDDAEVKKVEPSYPVLWVSTGRDGPFGETIKISVG